MSLLIKPYKFTMLPESVFKLFLKHLCRISVEPFSETTVPCQFHPLQTNQYSFTDSKGTMKKRITKLVTSTSRPPSRRLRLLDALTARGPHRTRTCDSQRSAPSCTPCPLGRSGTSSVDAFGSSPGAHEGCPRRCGRDRPGMYARSPASSPWDSSQCLSC